MTPELFLIYGLPAIIICFLATPLIEYGNADGRWYKWPVTLLCLTSVCWMFYGFYLSIDVP